MNALSISVTKLSIVINYFETLGLKKEMVLESLGIASSILESPDNRLKAQDIHKLFEKVLLLSNNSDIGLYLGERLSKGFSNILGYVLMNCRTLGDVSDKYCKYEKIVDETSITELKINGDDALVTITTIDRTLLDNRQFSDYKLSGLLSYIRILTGKNIKLKEVHFTHSSPGDTSAYTRVFTCPVYFNMDSNALVFNKSFLRIPIIEPNNTLLKMFERKAIETLELYNINQTYSSQVTSILLRQINTEMPSIKDVASKLKISVRSLQFYLQKEKTSFTQLSNNVRKDIALQFLNDKKTSIEEIAYILGFSEASAFHRAFKKWTSLTPAEFRVKVHL